MVPTERRGRAVAIVLAGITAALALGGPAAAALASTVGWRTVFLLLAVLAAVTAAKAYQCIHVTGLGTP